MIGAFEANLALGRRAEDVVRDQLLGAGLYVECRRDATGPRGDLSPRMHANGAHIPVPDFRAAGAGREAHVEVKGKQWISWFEMTDQLQHGIDGRALDYYRQTQEQTGLGVLLVVVELVSPCPPPSYRHTEVTRQASLGAWIDELRCRRSGSMVYFERSSLSEAWLQLLRGHKRVQLGFLLPEAYEP